MKKKLLFTLFAVAAIALQSCGTCKGYGCPMEMSKIELDKKETETNREYHALVRP